MQHIMQHKRSPSRTGGRATGPQPPDTARGVPRGRRRLPGQRGSAPAGGAPEAPGLRRSESPVSEVVPGFGPIPDGARAEPNPACGVTCTRYPALPRGSTHRRRSKPRCGTRRRPGENFRPRASGASDIASTGILLPWLRRPRRRAVPTPTNDAKSPCLALGYSGNRVRAWRPTPPRESTSFPP
jgi:hypothetical protein